MPNTVVLSARKQRLAELEETIEKNLCGFIAVGKALIEIRDNALFLETHKSFPEWAKQRFKIGRSTVYQYINAVKVRENLEHRGVQKLPENEKTSRLLTNLEDEDQAIVWNNAVAIAGDGTVLAKHVREAYRDHIQAHAMETANDTEEGFAEHCTQRYSVILADPPWQYDTGTVDPTRQVENQYPTMPLAEIKAMDVAGCCADNAVLFLWATAPLLPQALQVMEAWGFRYKTNAVWDKGRIGMGYWFRGQHEHLLLGVRGDPSRPDPGYLARSVLTEPRSEHSVKPECVYRLIETYYPDNAKLELFARQPRVGWHYWGNEIRE